MRTCGAYLLEKVIGEGAMAVVYAARHAKLQQEVAIKILRPEHVNDERALALFRAEAHALGRVRHPHVVNVIDCFQSELGEHCLVMELVRARTLRQYLRAGDPLLLPDVVHLGAQMAKALAAVHAAGVAHRDFKPDNIAVLEGDRFDEQRLAVKVLDFGVAKLLHRNEPELLVGTMPYLAPELLFGEPASARSDMYSLGVVLYEMLTGAPLIEPKTPAELFALHQRGVSPRLRELRPDVPEALASIIERALSVDDRPTMESMARALRMENMLKYQEAYAA